MTTQAEAPGAQFNFAQHLIERNAGRPSKTACIDDERSLSFGALADQIWRMGAALLLSALVKALCLGLSKPIFHNFPVWEIYCAFNARRIRLSHRKSAASSQCGERQTPG